ncbi:MAG: site-specific integrase [Clostridium sp.]
MKGSVRKRGTSWFYSFDIGIVEGKRKRNTKGGFRTKAEAEKGLRTALIEYEELGQVFKFSELTVVDYFMYWHKEYVITNCKYKTINYYKQIIDTHIVPFFKDYKLKQLTPAILQKFLNYKMINGYSKHSVSNFYGVLSGALKYAVYPCNYIKENPMSYVSMPKYQDTIKDSDTLKLISIDEFNKILTRFPKGSTFYIPLQIAFNTGMRGGEIAALMWDNVDLKNKTITIKYTQIEQGKKPNKEYVLGTPKTKSSYRTISIGDTLVDILRDHKEWQNCNKEKYGEWYTDSPYVCTKENGDQVTINTYKYLSRVINYELEINFTMHSLRHTHATLLLENGANPKDIQCRLGHSKLATTMDTYSHVTQKMKLNTVNIFENINSNLATT